MPQAGTFEPGVGEAARAGERLQPGSTDVLVRGGVPSAE
jgi:hypothetical protein